MAGINLIFGVETISVYHPIAHLAAHQIYFGCHNKTRLGNKFHFHRHLLNYFWGFTQVG
jgi:hypothetical protein